MWTWFQSIRLPYSIEVVFIIAACQLYTCAALPLLAFHGI